MLRILKTQSPGDYAFWSLGFLFFVGMHYFQSHPGGDGLQLSFNAFSWIPLSCFIGFCFFQIVRSSKLIYSELTLGLLLAYALLLIPAFYPDSLDITGLGRFYGLLAGLLIFIGLQQLELTAERRAQLLFFVIIAVLLQALLGWAQYFAWIPDYVMGYRADIRMPWGIFRQPNVMSSFMATGLVISAFLLPGYVAGTSRRAKLQAVICLLMPLITVPLIFNLNSRVGWLGGIIGVVCLLPLLFSRAGKRVGLGWILMIGMGVLVGILLLANSTSGFDQAAAKVQIDPARLKMYPVAINLFLENVFSGVGYGHFESAFNAFAATQYQAGLAEPSGVTNLHHPHNELIYWAAEGGVLALGGLLLAAWVVLRTILKNDKVMSLALVGLLFPIVLHTQTEYPFYHSVAHWVVFVILIYIVDANGNKMRSKTQKSTILFGTAGVVIPLVTTIFMVSTLHAAAIMNRFEQVPGTSPETLLKIVNPIVWRDRLLFTIRGNLMYAALSRGDTSQVQAFVDLINESIETKPRWQRYQDLILAYDFMNDEEMASRTYEEAKYRFPTKEFNRLRDGGIRFMTYTNRASIASGVE